MTYEQYLQKIQGGDSPSARQAFQDMYLKQRTENFGLGPNSDSASYLSPVRQNTATGEIGMWNLGGGASHGGHGAHEGAVQQTTRDWYKNKEFLNQDTDFARAYRGDIGSGSVSQLPSSYPDSYALQKPLDAYVGPEAYNTSLQDTGLLGTDYTSPSLLAPSSASNLPIGPSGLPSIDQLAGTGGGTGGAGSGQPLPQLDTAAEAGSEWGGPETFVANMALDMIPTRDRKKIDTPFGGKGSASGTFKGAGKGALVGMTLGGPVGAGVGGLVGAGLAGQGYFDSTSAPTMSVSRIKRGQGRMPVGGLLGMGGGMYG